MNAFFAQYLHQTFRDSVSNQYKKKYFDMPDMTRTYTEGSLINGFSVTFLVILCSYYFWDFQKKRSASAAYNSLYRGLKYLLKVRYNILVYPKVD